jgi:hypothetical protein
MKVFEKIVSVLPYLLVFVASLYPPSDPDLGWHLKYGEYFFQHQSILRDNTFSTMMPGFHWSNSSWLTDVVSYMLYASGGFFGLIIASALIVAMTFFFFSKAARLSVWDETLLFPLILYLETPINLVSFRGQQISMLLLGVLVFLLSLFEKRQKTIYLTIPLFLLWVNLHGEFILGLAFFAVWIAIYFLQKFFLIHKKDFRKTFSDTKNLGIVFLLCCLATFINPFGIGIHLTTLSHFGSPLLENIAEYLPFPMLSQPWWNQVIVAVLLGMGFIFLFFRERLSLNIPLFGGIILLYLLSFNVRRYAWPAYYLILPILKPFSNFFKPDKKKTMLIASGVMIIFMLIVVVFDKYPLSKFMTYSWDKYCQEYYIKCSPKSAEFIIKNKLTENLYSLYGWGGWLIWNYPEIKPTIDGRMHMWKDEKNYSGFIDYYEYEQNMKDIDVSSYNVVYMSYEKPIFYHMLKLVENGKWKLIYKDEFAGIFVRN